MFDTSAESESPPLVVYHLRDPLVGTFACRGITGGGQPQRIADSGSTHVKLTVTAVLFHPAAFAAGVADAEIVGAGIVSRTSCGSWSESWSMNSEFACRTS